MTTDGTGHVRGVVRCIETPGDCSYAFGATGRPGSVRSYLASKVRDTCPECGGDVVTLTQGFEFNHLNQRDGRRRETSETEGRHSRSGWFDGLE